MFIKNLKKPSNKEVLFLARRRNRIKSNKNEKKKKNYQKKS